MPTLNVPSLIAVTPLYVFALFAKVNVPEPALVRLTPLPEMTPVIELVPVLVTLNKALVAKAIPPALNTSVVTDSPVNGSEPPIVLVKVVSPVPLVIIVSACAPFKVLLKEILPFVVVVNTTSAPNVAAPV